MQSFLKWHIIKIIWRNKWMCFSLEKEIFLPAHWRKRPWRVLALVTLVIIFHLCTKYLIIQWPLKYDHLVRWLIIIFSLHQGALDIDAIILTGEAFSAHVHYSWNWRLIRAITQRHNKRSFWEIRSIRREICFER